MVNTAMENNNDMKNPWHGLGTDWAKVDTEEDCWIRRCMVFIVGMKKTGPDIYLLRIRVNNDDNPGTILHQSIIKAGNLKFAMQYGESYISEFLSAGLQEIMSRWPH